ncbi:hypothetical protein Q4I28_005288 [Leishmania naiffi]|uniref:Integral membrane protein n=1 Tax=Leishmania naiffi TaxID=5678 RepID=A0AAW3BK55_9TRYP
MLWTQRAFLVAAGAGAALSVGHYLVKVRSITGQVPVHFNLFGVPDGTAAPWAFALYPIISLGFTTAVVCAMFAPNSRTVLLPGSVEQVSTNTSLLCGQVAVLACQYYAARIAEGSADRVSLPVMYALYGILAAASAAVLATKSTVRSR